MNLSGKRILIIKQSSLGDVVHTLPLAHALKRCYPTCHIGWIVQRSFSGLLEPDPSVDEIIPIFIPSTSDPGAPKGAFKAAAQATWKTLRELRNKFRLKPYDFVLDLHASFRSGLLALTNPGGLRVGFADAKELNTWFQHDRLVPEPDRPHAVDKNLLFATHLGCTPEADDFRLVVSPEAREKVRRFLQESGVRTECKIVYANPAARWETKFWTIQAWAEFADLVIEKMDAMVVFAGSRDDSSYIQAIAERMKNTPVIAAGRLNLAEAVALLEASDIYVGVDSGPMHIAAFTGTPVVALFGPTDPDKVGPYGDGHRVIRRTDLDCLSCRKRSCSDRICLEGIAAETVFQETVEVLSQRAPQETFDPSRNSHFSAKIENSGKC
ncbi:MAG: glycosyltransferase family 9 protein [Desulfomonile tiedjei]|uniref:Glycosyltransferase family 9 protein n=1 Tax=Desulfomonile tiedjei TaxID=2358 RepID=A0A9D6Z5M8_9BACT|nr:glycosyltransferase family 9 protein [Desulfomonile tiedjei]